MNRKCRVSVCGRPATCGLYCGRHKNRAGSKHEAVDTPNPKYD